MTAPRRGQLGGKWRRRRFLFFFQSIDFGGSRWLLLLIAVPGRSFWALSALIVGVPMFIRARRRHGRLGGGRRRSIFPCPQHPWTDHHPPPWLTTRPTAVDVSIVADVRVCHSAVSFRRPMKSAPNQRTPLACARHFDFYVNYILRETSIRAVMPCQRPLQR